MEKWIKVYEEPIGISIEGIDVENYKTWVNEYLDDEAIPYKNIIRYDYNFAFSFNDGGFVVEVYVYDQDEDYVKKLIDKYSFDVDTEEEEEIYEDFEEDYEDGNYDDDE